MSLTETSSVNNSLMNIVALFNFLCLIHPVSERKIWKENTLNNSGNELYDKELIIMRRFKLFITIQVKANV